MEKLMKERRFRKLRRRRKIPVGGTANDLSEGPKEKGKRIVQRGRGAESRLKLRPEGKKFVKSLSRKNSGEGGH